MAEKQAKSVNGKARGPGRKFQPGQSGNPAGRPKDQEYKDAIALLKAKSPELMAKAISMVLCKKPSEKVMVAFINRICPEKLQLTDGEGKPFVMSVIIESRKEEDGR